VERFHDRTTARPRDFGQALVVGAQSRPLVRIRMGEASVPNRDRNSLTPVIGLDAKCAIRVELELGFVIARRAFLGEALEHDVPARVEDAEAALEATEQGVVLVEGVDGDADPIPAAGNVDRETCGALVPTMLAEQLCEEGGEGRPTQEVRGPARLEVARPGEDHALAVAASREQRIAALRG